LKADQKQTENGTKITPGEAGLIKVRVQNVDCMHIYQEAGA
jgi:hypothetical protein